MKIYTGIGSRETPNNILTIMTKLATLLSDTFILRSGGAEGADIAFENGCTGLKEIYIPWRGFNNNSSSLYNISSESLELASKIHPNWDRCSPGAKKLHARNCNQILGGDLKTPTNVVICWTRDGKASGGTGQALRLAKQHSIPIINLHSSLINYPEDYLSNLHKYVIEVCG